MTDNEIIKAFTACITSEDCSLCPMFRNCPTSLEVQKQALDLINRQQAENERLKDILYDADGVNLVNYWHQQCKIAENGCRNLVEELETAKAEAVKEFAERLEPLKKFRSGRVTSEYELCVTMREVDIVKKEMAGEG